MEDVPSAFTEEVSAVMLYDQLTRPARHGVATARQARTAKTTRGRRRCISVLRWRKAIREDSLRGRRRKRTPPPNRFGQGGGGGVASHSLSRQAPAASG